MAWTCEQTEDRLLDALDRALGPAELSEWDEHVAGCANCSRLAQSVRQTVDSLRDLPAAEPAPWLVPKILARTTGAAPRRRRFAWLDFLTHPRLALGAAAVLITVSILFRALSGGAPTTLAVLNPVELYHQADRHVHLVYADSVKFFSNLRVVYEIQSRFQPQPTSEPSASPEKKTTDQLEQLFYNRFESELGPFATHVLGDKHAMRYPS